MGNTPFKLFLSFFAEMTNRRKKRTRPKGFKGVLGGYPV
ncbi:hypothetical protein ADU37_CDS16870 [Thermococcus sp. 2319x1]|nr:hypothetical protein ADU37_CDS16870 [Thermococcus sp. 2319x1]